MSAMTQPTSPLDRPLTVTFFKNYAAAEKQEMNISMRRLLERVTTTTRNQKDKLPWLKLARFGDQRSDKNSLRNNGNVLGISGVEGDYDHEITTVDEACEIVRSAGIAAMIYTSPSHNEDAPRWRVLCPLSRDYGPAEREQFMARLNGIFLGALAGESFTLSQSYYFGSVKQSPSHRAELIDGDYLDARADHCQVAECYIRQPQGQLQVDPHDSRLRVLIQHLGAGEDHRRRILRVDRQRLECLAVPLDGAQGTTTEAAGAPSRAPRSAE